MHDKFAEIEENLFLKTKLVESLSRQLEIAAREAQAEAVRHQKEREIYQKRIDKLGKVAGWVPLLETEIETLRSVVYLRVLCTKKLGEKPDRTPLQRPAGRVRRESGRVAEPIHEEIPEA